jgi:hypothetical protein
VAGTRVAVIAPDTTAQAVVRLETHAACGRLGVSAILPASAWHADEWAPP